MKTKNLISAVLFLFISSVVMSQGIGILGGVNFQNMTGKDSDGDKLEYNLKLGFHAGVNIQIPIAPEFYFQPGLLFTTKGAKDTDGDEDLKFALNYIELPLSVVYKAELGNGKVYLGLGPYLACGIGGKIKSGDEEADIKFKNKVSQDDYEDFDGIYLKAFDAGGNIFAGYELSSGIFLQLNTQFGMIHMVPEYEGAEGDDKSSIKNTGFGLSLGFRF